MAIRLVLVRHGLSSFNARGLIQGRTDDSYLTEKGYEQARKAGEVLSNNLIIGCKDKAIKINLIQKEGKKVIDTKSFLAGYKISKGDILK